MLILGLLFVGLFQSSAPTLLFPTTNQNHNVVGKTQAFVKELVGPSCDDITPDLCSLESRRGTLNIRGLQLVYWKYSPGARQVIPTKKSSSSATSEPLVVVNGGPGLSHSYMLPLKQQACRSRRVTIFYDQVGTGESSRPQNITGEAPWLLTLDYYREELTALVAHLGLNRFHLLGHSWGGVIALMYATTNPVPPLGLVLASTFSDTQSCYRTLNNTLLSSLPPYTQKRLNILEDQGAYTSEEYTAIANHARALWWVRSVPFPTCLQDCLSGINVDLMVPMQGASEFRAGGVLGTFNVTAKLGLISSPALVIGGFYDVVALPELERLRDEIPRSRLVRSAHAAHMTMIDDTEEFNNEVAAFLLSVEDGTFRADPTPYNSRVVIKNLQIILSVSLLLLVILLIFLRRRYGNMRFISLASRDATSQNWRTAQ